MKRKIEEELLNWKKDNTYPLMLIGARQTGKTYILEKFCEDNFANYIYVNLERDERIKDIFENTIDPDKIIENIEILKNINFNIDDNVLFIDEIQESERAINSLKYFAESDKPYKVVCAGSLLGVKISRMKSSFPVGKVNIKYLYPMDFEEFLWAIDEEKLSNIIIENYNKNEELISSIHEKALELYKKYLCIGGMPAVIKNFIDNDKKINYVNFEIQDNIVTSYLADMTKYTSNSESVKINAIYNAIPKEIARENNTFKFSLIDRDARRERYASSISWLTSSFMTLECKLATNNISPLSAYASEDKFKLYLSDTGLLRSLSKIDYSEILNDSISIYNGAIAENYVATELYKSKKELYYFTFNPYEIDFLIKMNGEIIPIEVKAGRRNNSNSLKKYIEKYNPSYSIRISSKNFGFENNIKSVPLYAVFCITKNN